MRKGGNCLYVHIRTILYSILFAVEDCVINLLYLFNF